MEYVTFVMDQIYRNWKKFISFDFKWWSLGRMTTLDWIHHDKGFVSITFYCCAPIHVEKRWVKKSLNWLVTVKHLRSKSNFEGFSNQYILQPSTATTAELATIAPIPPQSNWPLTLAPELPTWLYGQEVSGHYYHLLNPYPPWFVKTQNNGKWRKATCWPALLYRTFYGASAGRTNDIHSTENDRVRRVN